MVRFTLLFTCLLTLTGPRATAQERLTPRRISAPIQERGTYHVATGTWLPRSAAASFASDVLYNNSAPAGYFFGATPTWDPVDEGRIPSTASSGIVGTADGYEVDCYSFAYCSNDPGSILQITVFLDLYAPCSDVDDGDVPLAGFLATGLPAGTPTGGQGCWTVAFDLSNTTLTFVMSGDGDGTWDNDANTDSFGWLCSYPTSTPTNGTGPIIAGNCAGGGSTSIPPKGFGTAFAGTPGATDATGLGTGDCFWIDANDGGVLTPNANGGCFFFGGCNNQTGSGANPWGGFYLLLFGTKKDEECGTRYCSSRVNQTGARAILTADCTDPGADLVLTSAPVPDTAGQFFYGPMMLGGALSLGDGLRCVGGMTSRVLPFINAGMMMQQPSTATFTVNYTAPYAVGLVGTQHFQHWFRSETSNGTGSGTSDAIAIDFGP